MYSAKKLGLAEYVRLAGFQENMPYIYQHADLFVFPSLQEGLSAALMEAMAAGLPCVVSDIRGNRELIDPRGGIRFPLGDQEQLAAAIGQLAQDPKMRKACGAYNRNKVKRYDLALVRKRMLNIYQRMEPDA